MTRNLQLQLELILSLVKRDLKARYKESVLGFFWSLLRPAFLTLILWLVFSRILPLSMTEGPAPYWLHVLVSILTWNFLLGSVTEATHSLVANGNLLKKVPLKAQVFPIAAVVSNGVHFTLALTIALVMVVVIGPGLRPEMLVLPLLVLLVALFATGLGMVLAALNVFYRDTGSALELAGLAWFYATPVIYSAGLALKSLSQGTAGGAAFLLYLANPAAPLVIGMRRATLYSQTTAEIPDSWLALTLGGVAALTTLLLVTGWVVFNRVGPDFADEL